MTDTADTAVPADSTRQVRSKRGRRILALVIILILLLMAGAGYLLFRLISPPGGAADADKTNGVTWVRSIYGINNTVQGSLERAQAAMSSSDGTIWVVDAIHKSLLRFTPEGRYTGAVTGPKDDPLTIPGRFAIGPDGKFYVVETSKDIVRVLDAQNRDQGSFKIPKPVSVAVSKDRIVVGAISGFAILESDGKPIKVIGSRGSGDDQFDYVHGVAIGDNGNIYVVDSWNNRLSAYDPTGKRLWIKRTGKPNNNAQTENNGPLTIPDQPDQDLKGTDAMQLPLGMTIDGAGRLVVVDMFESTLNVFDPKNGKLIAKYGTTGPEDGEFFYPVSVGYDKGRDWFTVADALNNRVQIIRLPNSAGSGGAQAAVRRTLAGPLRACVFPFLLIILALIAWMVYRTIRKRRAENDSQQDAIAASQDESGVEESTETVDDVSTETGEDSVEISSPE